MGEVPRAGEQGTAGAVCRCGHGRAWHGTGPCDYWLSPRELCRCAWWGAAQPEQNRNDATPKQD